MPLPRLFRALLAPLLATSPLTASLLTALPLAASPLLLATLPLHAQHPVVTPAPPKVITPDLPRDGQPYTLHVYPTLFQVPTLVVLDQGVTLAKPLGIDDFTISLDSGPVFKPLSVHVQGNDPTDIILLLDAGGDEKRLLPGIADALASLAPSLHPSDHIQMFAVDCHLIGIGQPLSHDPAALKQSVNTLLDAPDLHGAKPHSSCRSSLPLWDSIAYVSRRYSPVPSRRILLVLSEGRDGKSTLSFDKALDMERSSGAAVFVLRDNAVHQAWRATESAYRSHGLMTTSDQLAQMALSEGGGVYNIDPPSLPQALAQFLSDIRGRYILEFEAPAGATPGLHGIDIELSHEHGVARASTVTAALPDPSLANDPTVIPNDNAHAPVFGNKRPEQ